MANYSLPTNVAAGGTTTGHNTHTDTIHGFLNKFDTASGTNGQVLKHNGVGWAPGTDSSGSGIGGGIIFSGDATGAVSAHTLLASESATAATAGLPLIIPPGNYLLSTAPTLPSNIYMIAPSGARFFRSTSGTTMDIPTGAYLENITIENNSTATEVCVSLATNAKKVTFKRCKFIANENQMVYLNNTGIADLTFDQCEFSGLAYGILANSTNQTSGSWDMKRVRITHCVFDGSEADPIEFNHPSTSAPACGDYLVEGCTFINPTGSSTSSGFAIGFAGADGITVTNNDITARREAIHFEDDCRNFVAANNRIRSVSGTASQGGIVVYPTCQDGLIETNLVENVAGDAIDIIFDGSAAHSSNITIRGNTVKDPTGRGITVAADSTKGGQFIVTDNYVTGADGDAYDMSGDGENVIFDNNFALNNTGYGFNTNVSARLRSFRNNIAIGNTAGDYAGTAIASGHATIAPQRHAVLTSAASGGTSLTVPLFRLGRYADGYLTVQARRAGAATNRADSAWRVRWDATTLVGRRLHHVTNGTASHDTISMVNGVLSVNFTVSGAGNQMEVVAHFYGTTFESGETYSGTVAADTLTVTGSRSGNAALASLLTKLATAGIITDSSSA
jgi:hypothetical protein